MSHRDDLERDLRAALGDHAHEYDLPELIRELTREYGQARLDAMPTDRLWQIIARHDLALDRAMDATASDMEAAGYPDRADWLRHHWQTQRSAGLPALTDRDPLP